MVVIVQEPSGRVVTDAIGAYLYPDAIPDDRRTEFKQEFSSTGSWAVQVSEHDLHAGDYFISVRCGAKERACWTHPGKERLLQRHHKAGASLRY